MWFRRAFWWIAIASIFVVPLWVLFGRAMFGAPLGGLVFVQLLTAPLMAITIGALVGVTIARKEVRAARAYGWLDIAVVGGWILVALVHGFFVVDAAGNRSGSAFTALGGGETLSNVIASLTAIVVIVGAPAALIFQVWRLVRETRRRVNEFVDNLPTGTPVERPGAFTPGRQRGDVITGTVIEVDEQVNNDAAAPEVIEGSFEDLPDDDRGASGSGARSS